MTESAPTLSADDRDHWNRLGWLHLRGAIPASVVAMLRRSVAELEQWAADRGPGLHHFEQTDTGVAIARSERFVDDHHELAGFVGGALIGRLLAQLFGEPAVLFKEKVNFKYPGGGGFAPHQDATAYRFVDHHISVMVPVDPATVASGCLCFAPGHRDGVLPTDGRGRIADDVAAELDWRPIETGPGDLLVFDSYAPHRSDTNRSDLPRRALYLTYNAASKGDHRAPYYADKQAEFDRADGTYGRERVRISVIDDFLGRPVTP